MDVEEPYLCSRWSEDQEIKYNETISRRRAIKGQPKRSRSSKERKVYRMEWARKNTLKKAADVTANRLSQEAQIVAINKIGQAKNLKNSLISMRLTKPLVDLKKSRVAAFMSSFKGAVTNVWNMMTGWRETKSSMVNIIDRIFGIGANYDNASNGMKEVLVKFYDTKNKALVNKYL